MFTLRNTGNTKTFKGMVLSWKQKTKLEKSRLGNISVVPPLHPLAMFPSAFPEA